MRLVAGFQASHEAVALFAFGTGKSGRNCDEIDVSGFQLSLYQVIRRAHARVV